MDFREYLENQNLNPKTIQTHVRNLERYGKVGLSQKIMINKLNLLETWGRRLSAANSLSKYLQFKNQPNDEIVAYIHEANAEIQKESQTKICLKRP